MRIALIHFRPDTVILEQERRGFLRNAQLHETDVDSFNVFSQFPDREVFDQYDGIVIGGSGDFFVSQGDIPKERDMVHAVLDAAMNKQIPVAGICFGAQLIADALGGTVEMDVARKEIGTFTITKTPEAELCAVFSSLPSTFDVQLGHKDHVTRLPTDAVNLAKSELSDVQAYTIPGHHVYGFTFHPELDVAGMAERLQYMTTVPELREKYQLTSKSVSALLATMWDSEHAATPMQHFLRHVVGEKQSYGAAHIINA